MTQSRTDQQTTDQNRKEEEDQAEPREPGPIEQRDPNSSPPLAEQVKITDMQLWIDLSA